MLLTCFRAELHCIVFPVSLMPKGMVSPVAMAGNGEERHALDSKEFDRSVRFHYCRD